MIRNRPLPREPVPLAAVVARRPRPVPRPAGVALAV